MTARNDCFLNVMQIMKAYTVPRVPSPTFRRTRGLLCLYHRAECCLSHCCQVAIPGHEPRNILAFSFQKLYRRSCRQSSSHHLVLFTTSLGSFASRILCPPQLARKQAETYVHAFSCRCASFLERDLALASRTCHQNHEVRCTIPALPSILDSDRLTQPNMLIDLRPGSERTAAFLSGSTEASLAESGPGWRKTLRVVFRKWQDNDVSSTKICICS